MDKAIIIFPHQLFEDLSIFTSDVSVYMVEEFLFFKQYKFHKQKLVYHRATMKYYAEYLWKNNIKADYIETTHPNSDIRNLIKSLNHEGIKQICMYEVCDDWLENRIAQTSKKFDISVSVLDSPMFINSKHELKSYFEGKTKYHQTDFYIQQRKKYKILLDTNGGPIGGKWTFDIDNRAKYPKGQNPPKVRFPEANKYYDEAKIYVDENYKDNYGELNSNIIYPHDFPQAKQWLYDFFENRFYDFGTFEDAIVSHENIVHHSVLTPMLNIGLLTPKYVVNEALKYAANNKIPLNSLEGFIRQIIGWREFVRGMYLYEGRKERTTNFWNCKNTIPQNFWVATTGIEPIDTTIQKVVTTAYNHHIERLMVLGNFMLLCEFDPDEVYRWFMEMYIDAYDWVMVPNIYGMAQFADGGLFATKPYISGSAYVLKMSNFKKGQWCNIWDALFWRFIHKHRRFFVKNPRLNMMVKIFDKMDVEKQNNLLETANNFLMKMNNDVNTN